METFEARAKTFRTKLSALKRVKRFVGRRESATVAHDLEALLEGLGTDLSDARSALELMARLYEADRAILDRCDDSDGNIGDVFRFTARDYFVHYGSQCEDKVWLAARIVTLYDGDDYGVRSVVGPGGRSFKNKKVIEGFFLRWWDPQARSSWNPSGTLI